MDSMRHLSVNLPRTARQRNEPDILSSFKAAALSVTNLYKSAAADSTQARDAGYQDALEDILVFLDNDKIGMDDGEGWLVRKWVLERLEDAPSKNTTSEDEEEAGKPEDADTRCSSPEAQRKTVPQQPASDSTEAVERSTPSEPPQQPQSQAPASVPSLDEFNFRTTTQWPSNHERDNSQSMELDSTAPSTHRMSTKSSKSRLGRRDVRGSTTPSINVTLASGTNGKRKFPYGDFFDIGNLNFDSSDKKDLSRSSKRSKHS